MAVFTVGNAVGLLRKTTAPSKRYILWAQVDQVLNPNYIDIKYPVGDDGWELLYNDGFDKTTYVWDEDTPYNITDNQYVIHQRKLWRSLIINNLGNTPTEGAQWTEVNLKTGSIIPTWVAGIYGDGAQLVEHPTTGVLYQLTVTARPFESQDIDSEITSGNWAPVGGGYTKAEIDAFFEGEDSGKKQVDWARIINVPTDIGSVTNLEDNGTSVQNIVSADGQFDWNGYILNKDVGGNKYLTVPVSNVSYEMGVREAVDTDNGLGIYSISGTPALVFEFGREGITKNTSYKVIDYSGDFSVNYTANSLVPKSYVDATGPASLISTLIPMANGSSWTSSGFYGGSGRIGPESGTEMGPAITDVFSWGNASYRWAEIHTVQINGYGFPLPGAGYTAGDALVINGAGNLQFSTIVANSTTLQTAYDAGSSILIDPEDDNPFFINQTNYTSNRDSTVTYSGGVLSITNYRPIVKMATYYSDYFHNFFSYSVGAGETSVMIVGQHDTDTTPISGAHEAFVFTSGRNNGGVGTFYAGADPIRYSQAHTFSDDRDLVSKLYVDNAITAGSSNYYVNTATFNTTNGILTLGREGLSSLVVDLDGRFITGNENITISGVISGTGTTSITTTVTPDLILNNLGVSIFTDSELLLARDNGSPNIGNITIGGLVTYLEGALTFPSDTNNFVTGTTFNTLTGVLTLTRDGLSDLTVDLDGRYLTANNTITLSGAISGSGVGSISTTVNPELVLDQSTVSIFSDSQLLLARETSSIGKVSMNDMVTYLNGVLDLGTSDNNYVTGISFSTSNGVLTLTRTGLSNLTVDLDGRYLTSYTETSTLENVISRNATATTMPIFTDVRVDGYIRGGADGLVLNAGESYLYATGQTQEFIYLNAENGIRVSSSPDNWGSGWANRGESTLTGFNLVVNGQVLSSTDIANVKTAYTWGDHALAGYLTSNQSISVSGSMTGSGSTSISLTPTNTLIAGRTEQTSLTTSDFDFLISIGGNLRRLSFDTLNGRIDALSNFSATGEVTGSGNLASGLTLAADPTMISNQNTWTFGLSSTYEFMILVSGATLWKTSLGEIRDWLETNLNIGNDTITLSGDVTGSGTTGITTTLTYDAINGKSELPVLTDTSEFLITYAGVLRKVAASKLASYIGVENFGQDELGWSPTLTNVGSIPTPTLVEFGDFYYDRTFRSTTVSGVILFTTGIIAGQSNPTSTAVLIRVSLPTEAQPTANFSSALGGGCGPVTVETNNHQIVMQGHAQGYGGTKDLLLDIRIQNTSNLGVLITQNIAYFSVTFPN